MNIIDINNSNIVQQLSQLSNSEQVQEVNASTRITGVGSVNLSQTSNANNNITSCVFQYPKLASPNEESYSFDQIADVEELMQELQTFFVSGSPQSSENSTEGTPTLESEQNTTSPEYTSVVSTTTSANNQGFFSIYELMALCTEISHELKRESREIRNQELQIEQVQIQNQADLIREGAVLSLIFGIVFTAAQSTVMIASAAKTNTAAKTQQKILEDAGTKFSYSDARIAKKSTTQEAAQKTVAEMQKKSGLTESEASTYKETYFGKADKAQIKFNNDLKNGEFNNDIKNENIGSKNENKINNKSNIDNNINNESNIDNNDINNKENNIVNENEKNNIDNKATENKNIQNDNNIESDNNIINENKNIESKDNNTVNKEENNNIESENKKIENNEENVQSPEKKDGDSNIDTSKKAEAGDTQEAKTGEDGTKEVNEKKETGENKDEAKESGNDEIASKYKKERDNVVNAYEDGMKNFEKDLSNKREEVARLKNTGSKADLKQAESELKKMEKAQPYMRSLELQGKGKVLDKNEMEALQLKFESENTNNVRNASESLEFIKAGHDLNFWNSITQLGFSFQALTGSVPGTISQVYQSMSQSIEAETKETEMLYNDSNELMQGAQGLMDSVLKIIGAIVEIESSTNRSIIQG